MKEIQDLEKMFKELAGEIDPYIPMIPEFLSNLKETGKPLSILSTALLFSKIEYIRLGIFEVTKAEEFYSLNILFRSLLEHFVKAKYIWMKTMKQTGDEIGIDYFVHGRNQEAFEYAKNVEHSRSLVGIKIDITSAEALKRDGILTQEDPLKESRSRTDQFKYKKMAHFITQEFGKAGILEGIFPKYAALSSCVHGGPETVLTYENNPNNLKEIIDMSAFSSLNARWSLYTLYTKYQKKFWPLSQISRRYMYGFIKNTKPTKSKKKRGKTK